jgi:carbamoyltransferase
MYYILGLSAYYHDSAAALICDGEIISAGQEERFTRIKHDSSFPINAIKNVLSFEGIKLSDVDKVVFYDKPFLKFERLLETYLVNSPKGFKSFSMAMLVWIREKLFLKNLLVNELNNIQNKFDKSKLAFSEHHFSHAASAFFPSPFEEAIVLTLDGVGEWATSTVSIGSKNNLKIEKEIHFPHSLGLLYSAFTYYLGFKVNSGEYKVMGLAPYGDPIYKDLILENIVDLKKDGSFKINQKFFSYMYGLTMTNSKFETLFGRKKREPEIDEINKFHMDIAASIQNILEEIVLRIVSSLFKEYRIPYLCLAGGVALNCVANGKILKQNLFNNIWIQPASGDAGGAIGAALGFWYNELEKPRKINQKDSMKGSFLGHCYSSKEVKKELDECGAIYEEYSFGEIIYKTTDTLIAENAVGWFQGRMEFGPRALGARSILADPRSINMQRDLNLKVKYRESFRPFAPSILLEELVNWFDLSIESPYMLLVESVKKNKLLTPSQDSHLFTGLDKLKVKKSLIPAVTHVDNSARIHTVNKDFNPLFHKLLRSFFKKTGCPVLVNTSFNVRGEPIVCSPEDAFRCFMGTEIEALVIENYILFKKDQDIDLLEDYKNRYKLD